MKERKEISRSGAGLVTGGRVDESEWSRPALVWMKEVAVQ